MDSVNAFLQILENRLASLCQFRNSICAQFVVAFELIHILKQTQPLNDCFHIWYSSSCATINACRLGRATDEQVSWHEINAALGQVLLLLSYSPNTNTNCGIGLFPMGNFSKIRRGDVKAQYNLYTDDSFSLLPRRNFNLALLSLLRYIEELGIYVDQFDPVLQFPYTIKEQRINDVCLSYTNDIVWTRAMKFLLTDLKWATACFAKNA